MAAARRVRTPIRLSDDLAMPLDAITHTFGIFGQKGSGKSTTATVMVEQLVAAGGRALVFDPTGVWWGLTREGSGPGLPGVVLGGEHADAPLQPLSGALVAEFVLNSAYPLVVLDMKLLRKGQRQQLAMEILEALYHDNREPLMVVLDESPQFAPQMMRGKGEDAVVPRLLGAVEDVVSLGRSRGLGATLIAQRFAMVNTNVREQVGTVVGHRIMGTNDRKALKGWIEAQADPEREREVMEKIAKLPDGSALVWSPAFLDYFGVVAMDNATTFDSRATPKIGQRVKRPGKRAAVDLDTLTERMQSVIEEAQANDPKLLKKRLADAEAVARKQAENIDAYEAEADRLRKELADRPPETVTVDVPVISAEHVLELVTAVNMLRTAANPIAEALTKLVEQPHNVGKTMLRGPQARPADPPRQSTKSQLQTREAALAQADGDTDGSTLNSGSSRTGRAEAHAGSDRTARPGPEAAPERGATGGASSLTGPEQRVLNAIFWYEALGIMQPTRIMVGFIAGYRVTKKGGGTFSNILSALRNTDVPLIEYPTTGVVALTNEGRLLADDPLIVRTNEGIQSAVMERLDNPEQRVLAILIDVYPNAVSRIDLGTAAGYTVTAKGGGTFSNILSRLRTLGLIDYPNTGMAIATDVLFPLG